MRAAFRRMRWCLDCGAVQWGPRRCQACGGRYRAGALGFGALYDAHVGPLRRFVRRQAADRELPESLVDTEGVVHDTFMALVSASRQPVRKPAAWLFTAARNQVSKAVKAQRRTAPGDPASHLDDRGTAWTTLADLPADAEVIRAAREVMDKIAGLPGNQAIATYLKVQGWSLAEIGEYLNCAASTAGVHISRGTTKVRIALCEPARPAQYQYGDPLLLSRARRIVVHPYAVRPRWRRAVGAAARTLAGAMFVTVAAPLLGIRERLAFAVATAAVVLALSAISTVRWWLGREEVARRREEAASENYKPRHGSRLTAGRSLDPPGGTRWP